jgi:hypothetical protein
VRRVESMESKGTGTEMMTEGPRRSSVIAASKGGEEGANAAPATLSPLAAAIKPHVTSSLLSASLPPSITAVFVRGGTDSKIPPAGGGGGGSPTSKKGIPTESIKWVCPERPPPPPGLASGNWRLDAWREATQEDLLTARGPLKRRKSILVGGGDVSPAELQVLSPSS